MAPRISTVSPLRKPARQESASHAAGPPLPIAAATISLTLSGTGKPTSGSACVKLAKDREGGRNVVAP